MENFQSINFDLSAQYAACFSPPSKITYSMTRSYTQKLNSLNASLDLQIDRLQAINRSMRDVFSFPATTMTNNQSAAHNSDSNDEDEDIIMNEDQVTCV